MKNVLEALSASKYVATGPQVEQLAALVATGTTANGTYLRVLLAGTLHALGKPPRGRRNKGQLLAQQEQCLSRIHEQYYVHVLAGVGGEGAEQQRRGTFARTACSSLRRAIKGGIDLRQLDINTVSKGQLRKLLAPAEPENRIERAVQRSEKALLRAIGRMDVGERADTIDRIVAELDAIMPVPTGTAEIAAPPPPAPAITGHRLQRVHRSERPRAQASAH